MNPTIRLEHDTPRPGEPLAVRVLLTVEGNPPTDRDRVPLNLALVLDRSGSMGGPKIEAAREAAALAVQRLWPEDLVSVVAYNHEVAVVARPAPGTDQHDLVPLLRRITAGGTTNLSGGWLKGRELLKRNTPAGGMNRVLLLTDGLANQGITDSRRLVGMCQAAAAEGITTTTIGFGRDFDEDLLRAMADAGGGATYYIEAPDQAPGIFEEELEGLLSLTAQNVAAEIRTAPIVELAAVRHSYPATTHDLTLRLEMGDLYAREPKRLLMELLVDEVPNTDEAELATLTLEGDVLETGGGMAHVAMDLTCVLEVGGGGRVDPEIRREVLLLDAADARKEALEHRKSGDLKGAADALREASLKLRDAGLEDDRLEEEADDLERMADRADRYVMDASDAKYMAQRSYDSSRAREASYRRISRSRRARRQSRDPEAGPADRGTRGKGRPDHDESTG